MTLLIPLAILASQASARAFYFSPTGNDSNDGRTFRGAWHSLDRLKVETLHPGDQIVLTGAATYEGSIEVSQESGGDSEHPVVIRSLGKPSTILSAHNPAITIRCGGVELKDVCLRGGATMDNPKQPGLALIASGLPNEKGVAIENVDVAGFGGDGISISGAKANPNGFSDVRISNSKVHHNFGTGIISSDDTAFATAKFSHHDFHIVDCDVTDNKSGHGIILSGVDGAVVEYCSSMRNSGATGGLGMWAWCSQHVTFRYCIAALTHSSGGDGGGFDFDGGCTHCILEHCLSYHNDGPGYMHCDFPTAPPTRENVMRDSVSIDDGRKSHQAEPYGFGFVTWGSGLDDCLIEKNIVFTKMPDPHMKDTGGLFVAYIPEGTKKPDVPHVTGCRFKDNLVAVESAGHAFVRVDLPNPGQSSVRFIGNSYRSSIQPSFFAGRSPAKEYKATATWQKETGEDTSPTKWLNGVDLQARLAGYESLRPRQLPAFFKRLER
jgi:hypothetical protein